MSLKEGWIVDGKEFWEKERQENGTRIMYLTENMVEHENWVILIWVITPDNTCLIRLACKKSQSNERKKRRSERKREAL